MKKIFLKKLFFIVITLFLIEFANATSAISACPYTFTRELQYGQEDEEVYVLQQILNSDKRTVIATDGPGSPGQESDYFGSGTRNALKRFQALFIEYIGVADGKFNLKTRDVVQTICDGENVSPDSSKEQVTPKSVSTQPVIPTSRLEIILSSNATVVKPGATFKILVHTNKEIAKIDPNVVIVDGGTLQAVYKLSKTQNTLTIIPNDGAKNVNVQIEADRVKDVDGFTNENASNEINVAVSGSGIGSSINNAVNSISDTLGGLLNQLISTSPATQMCNGVQISAGSVCNPSLSAAPSSPSSGSPSSGGAQSPQQQQQQSPMSDLLSGLFGGLGKSASQGGGGSNNGQNSGQGGGVEKPEVEEGPGGKSTEAMGNVQIPANTPESCKKNYGMIVAGSCSTKDLTGKVTQSVADAGMAACAANGGKPVTVTSVHRTSQCNKSVGGSPTSNHLNGAAIDVPPRVTIITKAFEAKGLKRYDEINHWHYSMTGR